jgi:hypothetical protein
MSPIQTSSSLSYLNLIINDKSTSDTRTDAIAMRRSSEDLSEPSRNIEESNGAPSPTTPKPEVDLSFPPPEEDLEFNDGRVFTPPPHIAARFYRPTQARRKDSAASSRRNSISSAHSRPSVNAFSRHVGGPQSKYVAQHLRRVSFLEDRKARLADRAAHAEKVRLRAALAKASTRDTTASEERALAAQQARETKLAEIAAACAEEVKRAKAIAESTKEKREQELVKMRAQIEERLAEAERRREELRNRNATKRGRGQSMITRKAVDVMPQVKERETPTFSDDVAAGKVQWWWRAAMRQKAVREFLELGLTIDGVRDTSFEKVVDLLAQEKVLLITARILRICGLQEGDTGSVNEMAAVRSFLSAFLILGHPTQVLSNKDDKGEQEQVGAALAQPMPRDDLANPQLQELVGKARDLLISFENTLSRLTSTNNYTPPPALKESLPEAYATFYNAFIAWKSRDSSALIDVMLMQFVELDAIWQTVKDSTDDASMEPYRQSIKDNQLMLIVRIKKLAGQERGKKMIFEAVKQARKSRASKKPTGDTKPRATEGALPAEASATARSVVSPESHILSPPPTPVGKRETRPAPRTSGGLNGLIPDNRVVVHELAINQEYQIPAEEYREEQHRILFRHPILIRLRDLMELGDEEASFEVFMIISESIGNKLQRLVRPGGSLHELIREMFDADVAERQFTMGSFSYEKFFNAMAALLPKLCAPARDAELKDLLENRLGEGSVIQRVEALSGFIDVMVCDYVNYLLSTAAPQLIEAAPQYEAKMFSEQAAKLPNGFPVAEAAWRSARSKTIAEATRRDPDGINHPKSRPTAEKFYAQMLVDVFTQPGPVPAEKVPEMLLLDHLRVVRLTTQTLRIITAGAILLQCKNLLKRDVRAPWKTEVTRIFTVLEAKDQTLDSCVEGVMAALEAGRSMPAATKSHLRALIRKCLQASQDSVRDGIEPREPVLRLLLQRLRGHMLARLAAASASEKVRATSTAGEKLASLGLPEFVGKVQQMVDEIAKVGAVDRAAHGTWWEQVAEKVQREDDAATAAGSSSS